MDNVSVAACDWSLWCQDLGGAPQQAAANLRDETHQGDAHALHEPSVAKSATRVEAQSTSDCGEDRQGEGEEGCSGSDGGGRHLLDTEWDVIIGSDLVYNEQGVRMLPRVINPRVLSLFQIMSYVCIKVASI